MKIYILKSQILKSRIIVKLAVIFQLQGPLFI